MPLTPFGGFKAPDPNANYNVNNSQSMYGLKAFDPEDTRRKQRQMYQQMIQQGMNSARENSLASGSFNGEQSAYNTTQSARNAMLGADVDLDKYANEDQYKRFGAMQEADRSKLGWAGLDFQKYQYEDSKPSWLTGVLDFSTGIASAFLEDGGQVPDSAHFMNNYGGYIPPHEMNSPPTSNQPTNDNTLIKAKTGESIMNDQATSLLGADTVNSINNTAKMAGSFFNGGGQLPKPVGSNPNTLQSAMPVNSMGSSQGNMGWFNPQGNTMNNAGGLMGYGMQKAQSLFASGGVVGGNDDPYGISQIENEINALNAQLLSGRLRPDSPAQGGTMTMGDYMSLLSNTLQKRRAQSDMANQQKPNPQPQSNQNAPDANGNGIPDNMEKTITIKTRPIQQPQAPQENAGQGQGAGYVGGGMTRPF